MKYSFYKIEGIQRLEIFKSDLFLYRTFSVDNLEMAYYSFFISPANAIGWEE
jgi:hypothetical protein